MFARSRVNVRKKGRISTCFPIINTLHHYIVVRRDLPLGVLASQIVHAAGESPVERVKSGTHAVVLGVERESDLVQVSDALKLHGIPHTLIEEPDPPFCNQAMAIGVVPIEKSKVKRVLGRLSLLKELL